MSALTPPASIAGASDDEIRTALADAHLPSLLPALAQITGDSSLLRDDLLPSSEYPVQDQGGLNDEQQRKARDLAFAALVAFRDGGCKEAPAPGIEDVRHLMDFLIGKPATDEYLPLLLEELAFPNDDARAPDWRKDDLAPGRTFSVAIVGAGMSGILAAIRLMQAGVDVTVYEKNADFGGTWFENTYPGCRVDSSNHLYSYSFAQKADWPQHFSPQAVLLDYFTACADTYGVRDRVRFQTEVVSAAWDEEKSAWNLDVRTAAGAHEEVEAQALISAVGQLNRPKMPDIEGMNTFEGPSFHSAQWDHSLDLAGKRVAVIGTGASAVQFIPIVAERSEHLTIFQRTPNWFVPVPHYHDEVPSGLQWLFTHVPRYAQWYRFWLFWTTADGLLPMARVEDGWSGGEQAVGAANDQLREIMTAYMHQQLDDRPDLLPKVIPPYPPASKRILLDNGIWATTLKRENVDLVSEKIREITPRGVVTANGEEYPLDVIIYGTGFQASRFLTPMKVTGRNGIDLHEQWSGDARAYLGIVVPNFPNFYCLYGPNTNIVVNGSIVYFSECEVQYILASIKLLLEDGHLSMDVKKPVHDEYNVRIDKGNLGMAWGVSKVNSWYKSDSGRVAQNWPFSLLEYWQQTREPDPADYVLS